MPVQPQNNDVTAHLDLDGAIELGAIGLHRNVMAPETWASLSLEDQDIWRAEAEVVINAAAPLLSRQVADAVTTGILEAVGALLAAQEPATLTSIHEDGREGSHRQTGTAEPSEGASEALPAGQVG